MKDPKRALEYAHRAMAMAEEAGEGDLAENIEIIALALFQTGDTAAAIETQRRVVELLPEDEGLAETLARYEAALLDDEETP